MKKDSDTWTDDLSQNEVVFTKSAAEELRKASWSSTLLNDKKIKNALDVISDPNRSPDLTKQIKAALFEVRFAYAVQQAGLTAEYEHRTGMGNSTVDFKLNSDPVWLIELTSLRESNAVKESTFKSHNTLTYFSTSQPEENAAEVRDLIKAQQAIFSKASNQNGTPIKFPEPVENQFHMIVIDMRSSNAGMSDICDYKIIAHGSESLNSHPNKVFLNRNWFDGKNNIPIKGVFDLNHPETTRSKIICERIHALAFIKEESYNGIFKFITLQNPNFFKKQFDLKAKFPQALQHLFFACDMG